MRTSIVSWNVNGLRQRHKLNQFLPVFRHNPDIVCVQETKVARDKIPPDLKNLHGYHCYYDEKSRDDLIEVILFSRQEPERVIYGFDTIPFEGEGRVILAEYEAFTLLNIYFPLGSGPADSMDHKLTFYDAFLACVSRLHEQEQKVIICGDFSVAHTDNDLARPTRKTTRRVGITEQEREKLDRLIASGFSDTFRLFNQETGHYSWWPNGFYQNERGQGWRLDYIFVNSYIRPMVTGAEILACYEGSDHCPVIMEMEVPEEFPRGQYETSMNNGQDGLALHV
jgi:exodeoxyribonuclease-3